MTVRTPPLLPLAWLAAAAMLLPACSDGNARQPAQNPDPDAFCTQTAEKMHGACLLDVAEETMIAEANCLNVTDDAERAECLADAGDEATEETDLCDDQLAAREDVCALVGEARYDPDFDPLDFVDPALIGTVIAPNPYFPLVVGNEWVYEDEEGVETITVTVTNRTKLIEGVTCRVVRDVVEEDGVAVEITDDWYAQDLDGNVWYCGEISQNFEVFEGDVPEEPELVDIEGSWKAGRDGAKPGILVGFMPRVGDVYQQEILLGDAEDVSEVVSMTGTESAPGGSCSGDCLIARDFTPLEPDTDEFKYFAPGTGMILEVDAEGLRIELISFTAAP